MSIMPCYPDERSVENELGGKWELFFEETRDESGNVGYEWTADHNDDTPLNLNGVMIVFEKDTAIASSTSTCRFKINNDIIVNDTIISSTTLKSVFKSKVKNGLLESTFLRATSISGSVAVQPFNSFNGSYIFLNNIKEFSFSATNITSNTNIKIYVLRGV